MTGFPDWLVPVNISRQELAEITNRPRYGAAVSLFVVRSITLDGSQPIWNIAGRGMIYGGWLSAKSTELIDEDAPELYVDGDLVENLAFQDIHSFNNIHPDTSPYFLSHYDRVNFRSTIAIVYGYTFESSLEFRYFRTSSSTVAINALIFYALIT